MAIGVYVKQFFRFLLDWMLELPTKRFDKQTRFLQTSTCKEYCKNNVINNVKYLIFSIKLNHLLSILAVLNKVK